MNKYTIVCILSLLLMFASCGEYQKLLKSTDIPKKIKGAYKYYEQGDYMRAIRLYELIPQVMSGKPIMERPAYFYADSYYKANKGGGYETASYLFEKFYENYLDSDKASEALLKSARSIYYTVPKYSLDQTATHKAIGMLQNFQNTYVDNEEKMDEVNKMIKELNQIVEKKALEIGKNYEHTERYKEAVKSFDLFLIDYPGSTFKQDIYYYKLQATYNLAINSIKSKIESRLKDAQKIYQILVKYYPSTQYLDRANEINNKITEQLQNI